MKSPLPALQQPPLSSSPHPPPANTPSQPLPPQPPPPLFPSAMMDKDEELHLCIQRFVADTQSMMTEFSSLFITEVRRFADVCMEFSMAYRGVQEERCLMAQEVGSLKDEIDARHAQMEMMGKELREVREENEELIRQIELRCLGKLSVDSGGGGRVGNGSRRSSTRHGSMASSSGGGGGGGNGGCDSPRFDAKHRSYAIVNSMPSFPRRYSFTASSTLQDGTGHGDGRASMNDSAHELRYQQVSIDLNNLSPNIMMMMNNNVEHHRRNQQQHPNHSHHQHHGDQHPARPSDQSCSSLMLSDASFSALRRPSTSTSASASATYLALPPHHFIQTNHQHHAHQPSPPYLPSLSSSIKSSLSRVEQQHQPEFTANSNVGNHSKQRSPSYDTLSNSSVSPVTPSSNTTSTKNHRKCSDSSAVTPMVGGNIVHCPSVICSSAGTFYDAEEESNESMHVDDDDEDLAQATAQLNRLTNELLDEQDVCATPTNQHQHGPSFIVKTPSPNADFSLDQHYQAYRKPSTPVSSVSPAPASQGTPPPPGIVYLDVEPKPDLSRNRGGSISKNTKRRIHRGSKNKRTSGSGPGGGGGEDDHAQCFNVGAYPQDSLEVIDQQNGDEGKWSNQVAHPAPPRWSLLSSYRRGVYSHRHPVTTIPLAHIELTRYLLVEVRHMISPSHFYVIINDVKSGVNVWEEFAEYLQSFYRSMEYMSGNGGGCCPGGATCNAHENAVGDPAWRENFCLPPPPDQVVVGTYWAAYAHEEAEWRRCKVISLEEEHEEQELDGEPEVYAHVVDVDSGLSLSVPIGSLRPLSDDMIKMPAFAIRCSLAHIYPVRGCAGSEQDVPSLDPSSAYYGPYDLLWSEEACMLFEELSWDRILTASIIQLDPDGEPPHGGTGEIAQILLWAAEVESDGIDSGGDVDQAFTANNGGEVLINKRLIELGLASSVADDDGWLGQLSSTSEINHVPDDDCPTEADLDEDDQTPVEDEEEALIAENEDQLPSENGQLVESVEDGERDKAMDKTSNHFEREQTLVPEDFGLEDGTESLVGEEFENIDQHAEDKPIETNPQETPNNEERVDQEEFKPEAVRPTSFISITSLDMAKSNANCSDPSTELLLAPSHAQLESTFPSTQVMVTVNIPSPPPPTSSPGDLTTSNTPTCPPVSPEEIIPGSPTTSETSTELNESTFPLPPPASPLPEPAEPFVLEPNKLLLDQLEQRGLCEKYLDELRDEECRLLINRRPSLSLKTPTLVNPDEKEEEEKKEKHDKSLCPLIHHDPKKSDWIVHKHSQCLTLKKSLISEKFGYLFIVTSFLNPAHFFGVLPFGEKKVSLDLVKSYLTSLWVEDEGRHHLVSDVTSPYRKLINNVNDFYWQNIDHLEPIRTEQLEAIVLHLNSGRQVVDSQRQLIVFRVQVQNHQGTVFLRGQIVDQQQQSSKQPKTISKPSTPTEIGAEEKEDKTEPLENGQDRPVKRVVSVKRTRKTKFKFKVNSRSKWIVYALDMGVFYCVDQTDLFVPLDGDRYQNVKPFALEAKLYDLPPGKGQSPEFRNKMRTLVQRERVFGLRFVELDFTSQQQSVALYSLAHLTGKGQPLENGRDEARQSNKLSILGDLNKEMVKMVNILNLL